MSAVRDVLPNIRELIERYEGMGITEMETRASLINPLLNALGWRVGDLEQVRQEYGFQGSDSRVDYALMEAGKPSLFVEAKALGKNLGDQKWASQIVSYATMAGVEWVVLTDGNDYRIYNTHAPVPVSEKLFHAVRVTDDNHSVSEVLDLLSRSGRPKDRLKAQWRAQFVDRQVHKALNRLFGRVPDESFVRLLREGEAELTDEDVASSLRRVRAHFEFPLVHGGVPDPEPEPKPKPKPVDAQPNRVTSRLVRVRHLIAEGIIQPPLELQSRYRGQAYTARIETDGSIKFQERVFQSLSLAGNAVWLAGGYRGKGPAANGWNFWRFTDSDGQVKKMDVLRQRYLSGGGSDGS
ncbi:MAG: type I restriction enzyme HsdR N-terminal domain-containing protein [Chloroflexi bacterium]|nr:type I restriction enzyme HsdR N-terminal domain-containing protein [Chloroflexota bacterium]